jgi:hypothetical protein
MRRERKIERCRFFFLMEFIISLCSVLLSTFFVRRAQRLGLQMESDAYRKGDVVALILFCEWIGKIEPLHSFI